MNSPTELPRTQPLRHFKFLRATDLPRVFRDHTLKLSSADEVRRQEDSSAGFGDTMELAGVWSPEPGIAELRPDHPFSRSFGVTKPLRIRFDPRGTHFKITADGLLFCMSADAGSQMRERMRDEFGYDAVFEIRKPAALARALGKALGQEIGYGPVEYRAQHPRDAVAAFSIDPCRKDPRFEWQREVRFVSRPSPACPPSGVIRIPGLSRWLGPPRRF